MPVLPLVLLTNGSISGAHPTFARRCRLVIGAFGSNRALLPMCMISIDPIFNGKHSQEAFRSAHSQQNDQVWQAFLEVEVRKDPFQGSWFAL